MKALCIFGSRGFTDYAKLCSHVDAVLTHWDPSDIGALVNGGARGTDYLAAHWALERSLPTLFFPAEWGKYGRRAGFVRNETMARRADYFVAFWDGRSKGTKHMIDCVRKLEKELAVVVYGKETEIDETLKAFSQGDLLAHARSSAFYSKAGGGHLENGNA
jgi:hypothetical protein